MKHALLAITALLLAPLAISRAADRPNILWLVCEDSNVNWFGCYGNAQARTPNIDALARQGFRYTHASKYLRQSHTLPIPAATQKAGETQKKQDALKDM